jgi:outer membrane murein-binding lipoprotein Lpp
MAAEEKKTDTLGRIERAWKLVGIILGVLGLVSGGASWAFAYVMSERDRQVSELTEAVQDLEASVERMRDQISRDGERSEQDMRDVQMALRILEVRVGYESHVASVLTSSPPTLASARPGPEPEAPTSSPVPPSDLSAVLDRIRRRHPTPAARTESSQ